MQAQTQLQAIITISKTDSREVRQRKLDGILMAIDLLNSSPINYPEDIKTLFFEMKDWEFEEDTGRPVDRNFRFKDSDLYKTVVNAR